MREESSKKGPVIIVIVICLVGAIAGWVIWGMNRVITAVPAGSESSERVILVTPRATPTSEFEPTPTLTEEEQTALDEAAEEEDISPTEEPEEEEEPTVTPAEQEEEDPTPTEAE